MKIMSGNSNLPLARAIAAYLEIPLTDASVRRFSDEEVFVEPFKFKVDRSPNKLISFGHGGHMCLGMHLARLEMQAIYEELFSRVKSIELDGEPSFIKANFVGGPKSIPVRYKF